MDKKTQDEGDRLLVQRVLVVKNASSEHQPFDEKYLWTLFSQHSPQVAVFQHDDICVPAVGLLRFNSPREAYKAKRTFPSLTKMKEKEQEDLGLNILDFDPSKQYAVFDAHKLAEKILQQEKQSLAAVSCYGGGWVTMPGLVAGNSAYGLVSGSLPSPPDSVHVPQSASCPPQAYFSTVAGQGEVMPHYGQGVVGQWSVPYHQPGNGQAAVVVVGPPHHQVENQAVGASQLDYASLVSAPCSGYMTDPAATLYNDLSAFGADAASCQPWFPRDASQASPQPATAVLTVPASGHADASPTSWRCPQLSDSASDACLALPKANGSNFTTVPTSAANAKTQALRPTFLAARMSQNHGRRVDNLQVQTSTSNPSITTPETFSSTSSEPSFMCSASFDTCPTSQTISPVYVSTAQSTRAAQNPTLATVSHQDPVTAFSGHSQNLAMQHTSRAQTPSPFYGQTAAVSSTQPMGFIEFQQHLTQLANSLASQSLSVATCSGQRPQLTNQNIAPVGAAANLWRQPASVHGISGPQVVDPASHLRGPFAPEISCGYSFYPPSVPVSFHAAQPLDPGHAETTQGLSNRNFVKMHSMSNMPHSPLAMNTGSAHCAPPAIFANAASLKQHAGYLRAMVPAGAAIGGGTCAGVMPPTTQQMLTVNQHPTFYSIGQQMVNGKSLGLCAMPGFWQTSPGQLFPLQAAGALNSCNSWAAPTSPTMLQLQSRPVPLNTGGASMAVSASLPLMSSQRILSPPCQRGSGSWESVGSQQHGTGLRRCKSSFNCRRREPNAFPETFAPPFVEGNPPKNYHHLHQRQQLTKSETKALKAVARAMSDSQKSGKTAKSHHNPGQLYLKPGEVVERASASGGGDSTGHPAPGVPPTSEPNRRVTRHPEVGPATSVTRSATPAWGNNKRAGSERCALQDVGPSNHCDRVVFGPASGLVEKLR